MKHFGHSNSLRLAGVATLLGLFGSGCGGGVDDTDPGLATPGATDAGTDSAQNQPDAQVKPDTGSDSSPPDAANEAEAGCDPTAVEVCNGEDDNCDGQVDEGNPGGGVQCETQYAGICSAGTTQCDKGVLTCTGEILPGSQQEECNNVDDDCDGTVDNGNPGGGATCSTGLNGICADGTMRCVQGVHSCIPDFGPGEVAEVCNGLDDDCDGLIDEGLPTKSYYKDDDVDGYGTTASLQACAQPDGYSDKSGDCNDNNPNIHPGAIETCNDVDDNCNGSTDEGVQKPMFYRDNDSDGYGGTTTIFACSAPAGYVDVSGDCNDFNKDIHPFAAESCNDLDDDCNGLVDEGLSTQTIYKDNDGDGFAPASALSQAKCNVPIGWALAKDVNNDGTSDWDCNDSDTTVYPDAPTICGDSKDNNCDGYVDRLCFTQCTGTWPYKLTHSLGSPDVTAADLDGDGNFELMVQDSFGFAILSATGQQRFAHSAPVHNYSRNKLVLADIDGYDQHGAGVQTLEVLTGNGSNPVFYKLNSDQSVTVFSSTEAVYDASRFMARDMNNDGIVEFFTTSWCNAAQNTRIFRFNRALGTIEHVIDLADPNGSCVYTDGRTLTDLNNDGIPELVAGNGYAYPTNPSVWAGKIHTFEFTNLSTLAHQPYCAASSCFPTTVSGLYGGGVGELLRIGNEIRAQATYFLTDTPNVSNASTSRFWQYDLSGQPLAGSPTTTDITYKDVSDVDNDGVPESFSQVATFGLFDVNGDGHPDRIYASGLELRIALWNPAQATFVENVGSRATIAATGVGARAVWDINSDGRLDVLSSDENGNVYCHRLGGATWNKSSIVPPHIGTYLRTYQWDNYEPNEGTDTNADGIPDEVVRVASALTTKGNFYGYLMSADDKDYYLVDAGWGGQICMTSPPGQPYALKVFGLLDLWNNVTQAPAPDAKPDGLIWQDASNAPQKCFSGSLVTPYRYGEYRFIIGVESVNGSHSPYRPYWISAPK